MSLLLAVLVALGPWSMVTAAEPAHGCCEGMAMAQGDAHAGCEDPAGTDDSCGHPGCPMAHCAAAAFLPSTGSLALARTSDAPAAVKVRARPSQTSVPPTPPPIPQLFA